MDKETAKGLTKSINDIVITYISPGIVKRVSTSQRSSSVISCINVRTVSADCLSNSSEKRIAQDLMTSPDGSSQLCTHPHMHFRIGLSFAAVELRLEDGNAR